MSNLALTAPAPASTRLRSLDALRGATVAVMVLVNNAGGSDISYEQLRHSTWNGCTLTDLVFPLFLFIVGASIALSFQSRLARGVGRSAIVLQLLRRSVVIFTVGLLLNALPFFDLPHLRIYGVLQRIAICYAIAGLIYLFGGVLACGLLLPLLIFGYAYLLLHVRVPGFGVPGVDIPVLDPVMNLPAWMDRTLLPPAHLYHQTYYDPEGLLSTLGALATTLFGVVAAAWLQRPMAPRRRAFAAALAGVLVLNAGLLWSHTLPLNKRMYTSSFVLVTSGLAIVLWVLLHVWIDAKPKPSRWTKPWLVFGTNALSAYVLSEVLAILLTAIPGWHGASLQHDLFALIPSWMGSAALRSLVYSLTYVLVCYLPIAELYRRRIFLKF